jgi:hypothetical protein
MKKWALVVAAAVAFGPIAARADMKDLEAAAQKDGEVSWYV